MLRAWIQQLKNQWLIRKRPSSKQPAKPSRVRPFLEVLETRLTPAQLTVTSALDPIEPVAGTLRYALHQANIDALSGVSDTIVFNTSAMGSDTVTLQQGQLELNAASKATVTINGGGAVTLTGQNSIRVFQVDNGVNAALTGLTVSSGNAGNGYGGGIANWGNLSLTNCKITGCSAALGGAGILNEGSLTLNKDIITANKQTQGGNGGGGILSWGASSNLTVAGTTISDNSAAFTGGGLCLIDGGTLTMTNTTVTANTSARDGGGVTLQSITTNVNATLTSCTVTDNSASVGYSGGGILVIGSGKGTSANLTLQGGTVSGNTAGYGGGLANVASSGMATTNYANTQFTGNSPTNVVNHGGRVTSSLTVTDASDPAPRNPGTANPWTPGTLRYAVTQANLDAAAAISDTIRFNVTQMNSNLIGLSQGQLEMSGVGGLITIDGGSGAVSITGDDMSRIFLVDTRVQVALTGLNISSGSAAGYGGNLAGLEQGGENGGGIENYGTLAVSSCTLAGNVAYYGGGIANYGTLTVTNATVSENEAGVSTAPYSLNYGSMAAGIENFGALTVIDSTVSANTGGAGVANNSGAEPYSYSASNGLVGGGTATFNGTLLLEDTIVAGNSASSSSPSVSDVIGSVQPASSYNLVGNGSGMTGISNGDANHNQVGTTASPVNPLLVPLGSYGSYLQTMAPEAGSPAIGTGSAVAAVTTDERGRPRPGTPDIGAYQTQPAAFLVVSAPTTAIAGTGFSVTVYAVDAYGDIVINYSGPVTITCSDGQAVALSGKEVKTIPSPAVALINGMATVVATLDVVDNVTLTAYQQLQHIGIPTLTPPVLLTGTSAKITVSPPAANVVDGKGQVFYVTPDGDLWIKGQLKPVDSDVATLKVDGSGSVVTLGGKTAATVTLANGALSSAASYTFKVYPAGTSQPLQATTTAGLNEIAIDGSGHVIGLEGVTSVLNGQTTDSQFYSLVELAGPSYQTQIVDTGVRSFAIDGSGSVIVQDSNSTGNLARLPAPLYQRTTLPSSDGVTCNFTKFNVDGAGSVVALDGKGSLDRFAGSVTPVQIETGVSTFVMDGAGSVVALDGSGNLFRFTPGSTTPVRLTTTGSSTAPLKVLSVAVDREGWLVALDAGGNLVQFAPDKTSPLLLDNSCTSFVIDGTGLVVELTKGGVLNRYANGPYFTPQQLATGVSEFAMDSEGRIYWLSNGALTRLDGSTAENLGASDVKSFSLNADGTLTVLRSSVSEQMPITAIVNPSNAPVPPSLLACVGSVWINGVLNGTGTLLSAGANYFVLTALHVLENAPPGEIQFQLPPTSLGRAGFYSVREVIPDPSEDLALLELTQPIRGVQGAGFPDEATGFAAGVGQGVLQVGYGLTNDGSSYGAELYGFNQVTQVTTIPTVPGGSVLQYTYEPGQSAIAPGDSGGPDFTILTQTNVVAGGVFYIPVVVGVHEAVQGNGSIPYPPGTATYSVQITAAVAQWISKNANPFRVSGSFG